MVRNLTGADASPPLPVHSVNSHRVPYFRYFGPTAIVPGFKQMVVSVREHRRSTGAASSRASMLITLFFYMQKAKRKCLPNPGLEGQSQGERHHKEAPIPAYR